MKIEVGDVFLIKAGARYEYRYYVALGRNRDKWRSVTAQVEQVWVCTSVDNKYFYLDRDIAIWKNGFDSSGKVVYLGKLKPRYKRLFSKQVWE